MKCIFKIIVKICYIDFFQHYFFSRCADERKVSSIISALMHLTSWSAVNFAIKLPREFRKKSKFIGCIMGTLILFIELITSCKRCGQCLTIMNRKFLFTLRIISFTNELFTLMWYIMVIIVCSSESITHCCCRIMYLLDKPYFVYYITVCTTSKKTSCSNIENMIWLLNRKCKCSDDYWMNIRHLPSCLKYAQARNMKFSICKKNDY